MSYRFNDLNLADPNYAAWSDLHRRRRLFRFSFFGALPAIVLLGPLFFPICFLYIPRYRST